jgi:hypothetical protein
MKISSMKEKVIHKIVLATLFGAISATSVQAIENQKTVCSHGNQTRVIEVVYTTETETPCEVRYSKEDGMTTPWSANNLAGFCEEKAAAFIDKQEVWGWACEAAPNESASDEMAVSGNEKIEVINEVATTETSAIEAPIIEAPITEAPTLETSVVESSDTTTTVQ